MPNNPKRKCCHRQAEDPPESPVPLADPRNNEANPQSKGNQKSKEADPGAANRKLHQRTSPGLKAGKELPARNLKGPDPEDQRKNNETAQNLCR